jgi:hypothetical protein
MAAAIWLTPAGNLGTIPESVYYQYQFDAYNPAGGNLVYSLITGSLPSGISLSSAGMLYGIPNAVVRETTSTFTVRIKTIQSVVTDRTFSLAVGFIIPPIIVPEPGSLGNYVAGSWVDLQLTATEPTGSLTSVFTLDSGEFPAGLTLTSTGRIYGYLTPPVRPDSIPNFDISPFDIYPFDFPGQGINRNYTFSIKADDGAGIDINTYSLFIYARTSLSADNDQITADNDSSITADISNRYSPILTTPPGLVGQIRQGTNFAFQFSAEDFDKDTLTFTANSGLPANVTLDSATGWLTGNVSSAALGNVDYSFTVNVSKTTGSEVFVSQNREYNVILLGTQDNTVHWVTNSNIGSIYNGSISDFVVEASIPSGDTLYYKLVNSSIGALPYGLKLLPSGVLSGRTSFQLTGNNQVFTFTIAAYDQNNLSYNEKTFTINVVKRDQRPYENLYIQLLPARDDRVRYSDIINNSNIFPDEFIYRIEDPWFGKNIRRRSLFLTGLNPSLAAEYIDAMMLNHYWKTLSFGDVKVAQALDDNFDVKYEVVYIDLVDNDVNEQGQSAPLEINWTQNSENISTVYPNSFTNMVKRLSDGVGFLDRSILPDWMTSRQTNGRVLGFTRALVMAYVVPNKGSQVAYNLRQVLNELKKIDFTVDRYEWDNILGDSYLKTPISGTGSLTSLTTSANIAGNAVDIIIDSSSNALTITNINSTALANNGPYDQGAMSFNGTDQYLSFPYDVGFDFGSGNFTVECWVYFDTLSATTTLFAINMQTPLSTSAGYAQCRVDVQSNGSAKLLASINPNSWVYTNASAAGVFSAGQWYHVAIVRRGTSFVLYVNGVSKLSYILSGILNNTNGTSWIGAVNNSGSATQYINAKISDLRIVKGTAVYISNFTPPQSALTAIPNTKLLLNVVYPTTHFEYELSTNAVVYADNTVLGNVSSVYNSSSFALTGNASINVSLQSFTYDHIFLVNNFSTGSGIIATDNTSNVVIGQVVYANITGLISGVANSDVITGTGTYFRTDLFPGKPIYSNLYGNVDANTIGIVSSITSDTSLTLVSNVVSTFSGSSMYTSGSSTRFVNEIHHGDTIISGGIVLGTVKSIVSNTALILTANATSTVTNVSYSHTARDPYTIPGQGDKYLKFPQYGVLT